MYYDSWRGRSASELSSSALSFLLFLFRVSLRVLVLRPCQIPLDLSLLSLALSFLYSPPFILSRYVFFSELARASTRASPRKASSRAIPVITTTSIFVKSLSPLSLPPPPPPSPPFYPLRRLPYTDWSFDLPLYKLAIAAPDENRQPPPSASPSGRGCDIFQIINFYECRAYARPSIPPTYLSFSTDAFSSLLPFPPACDMPSVRLDLSDFARRAEKRKARRPEGEYFLLCLSVCLSFSLLLLLIIIFFSMQLSYFLI